MPPSSDAAFALIAAAAVLLAGSAGYGALRRGHAHVVTILGSLLIAVAGAVALVAPSAAFAPPFAGHALSVLLSPRTGLFLIALGIGGAGTALLAPLAAGRTLRPAALDITLLGQLLAVASQDPMALVTGWGISVFGIAYLSDDDGEPTTANLGPALCGLAALTMKVVLTTPGAPAPAAALPFAVLGFAALAGLPPFHAARLRAARHPVARALMNGVLPMTAIAGLVQSVAVDGGGAPALDALLLFAVGVGAVYAALLAVTATDLGRVAGYATASVAGLAFVAAITHSLIPHGSASPGALIAAVLLALTLAPAGVATSAAIAHLGAGGHDLDSRPRPRSGPAGATVVLTFAGLTALPPFAGHLAAWLVVATATRAVAATVASQAALAAAVAVTVTIAAVQVAVMTRLGAVLLAVGRRPVATGDGTGGAGWLAIALTAAATFLLGPVAAPLLLPAVTRLATVDPGARSLDLAAMTSAGLITAASAVILFVPLAAAALARLGREKAAPSADAASSDDDALSASGYAQPLTSALARLYRPEGATELTAGDSAYSPETLRYVHRLNPAPRQLAAAVTSRLADVVERLRARDTAAVAPRLGLLLAVLALALLRP